MKLILIPNAANNSCGHSIEITRSLERIVPNGPDYIKVWYANPGSGKYMTDNDYYIKRARKLSFHSICNILNGKIHTSISKEQICFLKKINDSFEYVHIEDPIFYDSFRSLYPEQFINVHFHNVFLRIKTRCQVLNLKVDYQFRLLLKLVSNLEMRIFRDEKVKKIFICKEDADFYREMTGNDDYEIWPVSIDSELMKKNQETFDWNKRFVWFGGIKAHKKESVQRFISDVFKPLKNNYPQLEFHLWGSGSQVFNSPTDNIFGHDFFQGNGFPNKNNSLYINPDLTGGGVKLKIKSFLENGVPFISTPFGFEGYEHELIDNKYCHVTPFNKWKEYILNNFK